MRGVEPNDTFGNAGQLQSDELKIKKEKKRGAYSCNNAVLNYQFNSFFSIFAGFQHGEKPPSYNLVDKSFKVGLTYKFRFKSAN